jgi:hypothetical protein
MIWQDYFLRMSAWDWLFWSLVLFDFAWLALPPLVFLFHGSVSTHRTESGMDDADLPVDPRVCQQLLDLGVQPLGAASTRDWLTFNGWNQWQKQYVFGGGAGRCLVQVWITYEGESPYVRFLSFFRDGQADCTTNEFAGQFQNGTFAASGLITLDVQRLAAVHTDRVTGRLANGLVLERHDHLDLLFAGYARQRLPFWYRCWMAAGRLAMFVAMLVLLFTTKSEFGSDTALVLIGMFCTHLIPLLLWAGDKSAVSPREQLLEAEREAMEQADAPPAESPNQSS